MGDYRDAIVADPTAPNVLATRSYAHPKYGFGLNVEQAITDDLGLFGPGRVEQRPVRDLGLHRGRPDPVPSGCR